MLKREELLKILFYIIEPQLSVHHLKRIFIYHFVGALEYDLVCRYQNEPHVTPEIALGQTSGKRNLSTIKTKNCATSFREKSV